MLATSYLEYRALATAFHLCRATLLCETVSAESRYLSLQWVSCKPGCSCACRLGLVRDQAQDRRLERDRLIHAPNKLRGKTRGSRRNPCATYSRACSAWACKHQPVKLSGWSDRNTSEAVVKVIDIASRGSLAQLRGTADPFGGPSIRGVGRALWIKTYVWFRSLHQVDFAAPSSSPQVCAVFSKDSLQSSAHTTFVFSVKQHKTAVSNLLQHRGGRMW